MADRTTTTSPNTAAKDSNTQTSSVASPVAVGETSHSSYLDNIMTRFSMAAQGTITNLKNRSISAVDYLSGRTANLQRWQRADQAEDRLLSNRLSFYLSRFSPNSSRNTQQMNDVTIQDKQDSTDGREIEIEDENGLFNRQTEITTTTLDLPHNEQASVNREAVAFNRQVDIGQGRVINTFILDPHPAFDKNSIDKDNGSLTKVENNLVICHGFGAGLGLWYQNYRALANLPPNWRVYSIDWLGMGRSSRTPLPKRDWDASEEDDVEAVESYFLQSLEDWRQKMGIEKMCLLGHSLGGYLSISYSLRYPERVEKLILASPAGIPRKPLVNPMLEQLTAGQKRAFALFSQLWEWDVTPQKVIRASGPIGYRLIKSYCERRFTALPNEDLMDVIEYMHSISSLDGTGEYALNRLLAPGAWARRPQEENLERLKMPIYFMYGEVDWMSPTVPIRLCQEGKLNKDSRVIIVPNAGHQLFLDNPKYFNAALIEKLLSIRQ